MNRVTHHIVNWDGTTSYIDRDCNSTVPSSFGEVAELYLGCVSRQAPSDVYFVSTATPRPLPMRVVGERGRYSIQGRAHRVRKDGV